MSTQANRRILVIDDLPSIHEDFRRILSGPDDLGPDAGPDSGPGAGPDLGAAEEMIFGDVPEPACGPGFDLDSAYQGREGLEMVRSSLQEDCPYALAFVDLQMPPGWDGVETISQIWKVDPRLQIVICSASSDYAWDAMLGELGAEHRILILKKPIDNVEVAQLASALTAKWDLTQQAERREKRFEDAVSERTRVLEIAVRELEARVGEATQLATHDALTGLPNRLLFADRAAQVLAVARRTGARPAVMMLDLNRFKEVNDTLGHLHGDLLLTKVAERLSGVLRPGDTVARFGGDEFMLLLSDGGSEAGAQVAKRIGEALEAPFDLRDTMVEVAVSIGIAAADSGEQPALEELLRQADFAMYKAKTGGGGFAHFASGDDDGTPIRLTLIGELRQALDCDELVVYYQPKVAVDSGELLGVEALVRWQHPTRGLLMPEEFIDLAEGSTVIQRLTTFVMDRALRCSRTWLDRGLRLPVAVNVSARSLCDPQFPSMVSDRLEQAGVPPGLLTIELSEKTALAYPGMALGILAKVRETGVHISVDDCGPGSSSPGYLKNLPVTELKIDQAIIKDLVDDPHEAVIVASATELAHNLGLSVVAEGVEDEMTLRTLKSIGVDIVQGYHLGHPMPEDLLSRWIEDRPSVRVSSPEAARSRPSQDHDR